MPLTLNLSTSALAAPAHLARAHSQASQAMARLASGLRIQSARDDTAGLGISVRISAEASASQRISRGVNDGIGLIQTAEGGLREVGDKLQRARELAVQAANASLRPTDRAALAQAFQGLLQDIDKLAQSTQFNGIYPLIGQSVSTPVLGNTPLLTSLFPSSGESVTMASGIKPVAVIPAGAQNVLLGVDSFGMDDDIQLFTRDGRHVAGTPLNDVAWQANGVANAADMATKVLTTANGFFDGASYDASGLLDGASSYTSPQSTPPSAGMSSTAAGMTVTYSGDGDRFDGSPNNSVVAPGRTFERVLVSQTTEPLILMVVGSGSFEATASWSAMPSPNPGPPAGTVDKRTGPTEIVVGASVHSTMQTVTIEQTPAELTALGLDSSVLDTAAAAYAALTSLDAALEQVSAHRATLAGKSGRLERVIETVGVQFESARASMARITDADYAVESSELARARVLADASRAMLAQSKVSAELALSLLRDG